MKGPTRQHHTLAVNETLTPAPGGKPTSDVFEGKGGAEGDVCGPEGSVPADKYQPPMPPTANPDRRW